MAGDLARRTKLAGPVLLRTISSRVELVVVCRKLPEVIIFVPREMILELTDAFHPCLAPRSVLRHYFDVRIQVYFLFMFNVITDCFPCQDNIDSRSEFEDDNKSASAFSVVSNFDNFDTNTLGDISPDAL
jgi:hypothetical protein